MMLPEREAPVLDVRELADPAGVGMDAERLGLVGGGQHHPALGAAADANRAALRQRIAAFQVLQGLPSDGRAGPLTLMQLNRVAGVDEPRLEATEPR